MTMIHAKEGMPSGAEAGGGVSAGDAATDGYGAEEGIGMSAGNAPTDGYGEGVPGPCG